MPSARCPPHLPAGEGRWHLAKRAIRASRKTLENQGEGLWLWSMGEAGMGITSNEGLEERLRAWKEGI